MHGSERRGFALQCFSLFLGADFTSLGITVTVPPTNNPGIQNYELPQFYSVIDDNIDEDEQSFALQVEIGTDVPSSTSCFMLGQDTTDCVGRLGATKINIRDNDRKQNPHHNYTINSIILLCTISCV